MARPLRLEFRGVLYHVTARSDRSDRSDRREDICFIDTDREILGARVSGRKPEAWVDLFRDIALKNFSMQINRIAIILFRKTLPDFCPPSRSQVLFRWCRPRSFVNKLLQPIELKQVFS